MRVLRLQEGGEGGDAGWLRNVERVVLDRGQPAVGGEGFGAVELCVLVERGEGAFAPLGVAGGEVDEEGPVVEAGLGVLEGELADWEGGRGG